MGRVHASSVEAAGNASYLYWSTRVCFLELFSLCHESKKESAQHVDTLTNMADPELEPILNLPFFWPNKSEP